MRAISLWQPWASAIALGHKHIETRGWSTKYRGPLVIHAAKRWTKDQRDFASTEFTLGRLPRALPLGAYVAVADLVDVQETGTLKLTVDAIERLYGNYEPGRFGWVLENIRPLHEPVPAVGKQGFWTPTPAELRDITVQL